MTDAELLEQLVTHIKQMHLADDLYGSGFYGENSWLIPYKKLRELVDLPPSDFIDDNT